MRKLVNTVLAGGLGLSMLAGVSAQTTNTGDASIEVTVNDSGTLSVVVDHAPDFGVVPYSLANQTIDSNNAVDLAGDATDTDLDITATDNRGGSLGWNVTLTGDNFTTGGDDPLEFAVTNLTIGAGTNSTNPIIGTGTVTLTAPADLSSTTTVMSADAVSSSNGEYTSTFSGNSLVVPAGTLQGDYRSTLIVEITTGP